jgi:hypothetical protein
MIDESKGMSKAKWERLWNIAHSPPSKKSIEANKKFISDFENMKDNAELRALSNISLQRRLNDNEYQRFMELGRKAGIMMEVKTKKNFGGYTPNMIKGGLADNINPKYFNQLELGKGIKVELEHTNDPKIAREIATDHLSENPKYYEELEKIEGKTKPITVKVSHKEIRRDKNQLEKDLQKSIEETQYPDEKKRLEHLYRELREADNHTKLKRFYNEYGATLKTLGMAIPFYFLAPVITAGIIIGATVTGDVPANMVAIRMAVPLTASLIGTLGVKYSVRTLQAIKQREKEIIKEKSQELRDNTILPEKEIKIIAKRVAQQELKNTKLVTELSV